MTSKYIKSNNGIDHLNITADQIKKKLKDRSLDNIVHKLEKMVKKYNIGFPFKKHFMENPDYYYKNIFKIDVGFKSKPFRFTNIIPKMGFERFEKLFDYKYDGKYQYIEDNYDYYKDINILTDYFTEKPRVESTGHGEKESPMDIWEKYQAEIFAELIKTGQDITAETIREYIYKRVTEARMGKIAQYYALLKHFNVKRFLDPSCAWGDRLIAAIAHQCDYVGIDPNKDLIEGHSKIIEKFGKDNTKKYRIIYKPFEDVNIKELGKFDFVLSSPAPFEGDVYGNREGQSTDSYKEFDEWFIKYMYKTCTQSYLLMEAKGHFLITVLDRLYPTKYAIVELLLLSILYGCKNLYYRGVIGWGAAKGKVVPFWVFQRRDDYESKEKIELSKQMLERYYPEISKKLTQYE